MRNDYHRKFFSIEGDYNSALYYNLLIQRIIDFEKDKEYIISANKYYEFYGKRYNMAEVSLLINTINYINNVKLPDYFKFMD